MVTYIRSIGIARFYLGVLLAAMALGQLLSLPAFVEIVEEYRLGVLPSIAVAAVLLVLEVVAAVGLLAPRKTFPRLGEWAGLAVAVIWTLMAVQALARGIELDNCGCFGAYLGQRLSGWILLQDAVFVALAVFVVVRSSTRRRWRASS